MSLAGADKERKVTTTRHEIGTKFAPSRIREVSCDLVDRALDIPFTESERNSNCRFFSSLLSPFGFFFFLGPHAGDLLGFS